ncbi:MAG TPA: efflux RND transporter periplasmic adaptor subunit [Candidatus Cloacimonadota bacterium]|nr:efflux RND transporter periplasmic adaptor subunit [Candidatus Cloacimonadota bacterium]HPS39012.1 efflux RND transporter periplasmic adaptor subunit [Candidatus Cloacimonadota bacterium]
MRKKYKVGIGIGIVLILVFIGLGQCGKKIAKQALAAPTDNSYTVKKGDIVNQIDITGEVQPQTVVSLKSKVSGKIVKFYVNENDYVKSGQIIADIEPDYNQANTLFNTKAQLQKAKISLDYAQKDLANKQQLYAKDYIAKETLDAAQDALANAQIEYKQASSQYEMISDLDTGAKVTHVFATSSGVCIERTVNEGEMVQSSISSYGEGTVVMKIADLNKMIVKSNINEVDIAKFNLGQEAKISLDALPYDSFEGKIVKIAPQATTENNAKVFPVEISINATGEKAKPGMTAAVSIIGEKKEGVLIIPIRGVFSNDDNQDIVYVMPAKSAKTTKTATPAASKTKAGVIPTQTGKATVVKLGSNDMEMVEVISGIKEGDIISLTDPNAAKSGPSMMMM